MPNEPQLLINAGLFVGGLFSGAYSAFKIRAIKNGNGNCQTERRPCNP